jgi:maltooligosyltrehalose trehalohydrolase
LPARLLYFADHEKDLAEAVRKGRVEFLTQFRSIAESDVIAELHDPGDWATFESSRLDHSEALSNTEVYTLHGDLLRLRREDPVFGNPLPRGVDGAVLSDETLVLRYLRGGPEDRLLIVNLGRDLEFDPSPEPLLAPPRGMQWAHLWSSEDPRYGGGGMVVVPGKKGWLIMGQSAVVLHAVPDAPRARPRVAVSRTANS